MDEEHCGDGAAAEAVLEWKHTAEVQSCLRSLSCAAAAMRLTPYRNQKLECRPQVDFEYKDVTGTGASRGRISVGANFGQKVLESEVAEYGGNIWVVGLYISLSFDNRQQFYIEHIEAHFR